MHLRRALLLFALVLGLAALIASLAPPPPERRSGPERPPPSTGRPQAEPRQKAGNAVRVDFEHAERAQTKPVEVPAHVIVTVEVPQAGQVELQGLAQIEDAEADTPATFDLFLDQPGRYRVVFTPVKGRSRRLGTLLARTAPPGRVRDQSQAGTGASAG
jgi:hypothetical protein